MIVTRIITQTDEFYPFAYKVQTEDGYFEDELADQIEEWVYETKIISLMMRGAIYFSTENDVTMFLLKFG
jgi:hypothetical protein